MGRTALGAGQPALGTLGTTPSTPQGTNSQHPAPLRHYPQDPASLRALPPSILKLGLCGRHRNPHPLVLQAWWKGCEPSSSFELSSLWPESRGCRVLTRPAQVLSRPWGLEYQGM